MSHAIDLLIAIAAVLVLVVGVAVFLAWVIAGAFPW